MNTSPNLYYLAGLMDNCLIISLKKEKNRIRIFGNIRGDNSQLHFIQCLFGGICRKEKRGKNSLVLNSTEINNIASKLKEIPSFYQNIYKLINQLQDKRINFNTETDNLELYKKEIKNILEEIKNDYNKNYSLLTFQNNEDFINYQTGIIESSKWLYHSLKNKTRLEFYWVPNKKSFYPESVVSKNYISGKKLINFINHYSPYMNFKKEIFLLAAKFQKERTLENSSKLHNEFKLFKKEFENNFQLNFAKSYLEYQQILIKQKEEKIILKLKIKEELRQKREIEKQIKLEQEKKEKEIKRQQKKQISEEKRQKIKLERIQKREQKEELRNNEKLLVSLGRMKCRKCSEEKTLDFFSKACHSHTGYTLYCKQCCYKDHYLPNKERKSILSKEWRKNNPESVKRASLKEKSKPHNRIRSVIKNRIRSYLRPFGQSSKYKDIISCSPKELSDYLQSKFTPEMTWENYGKYWHIDHIIPCSVFDFSKPNHLQWCWHHKNLQPLSSVENINKRDLLPNGEVASILKKNDPKRLNEIVAQELEKMKIISAQKYYESLNSNDKIISILL